VTTVDFGFIGLGRMGAPLALRLLERGYSLCVCDLSDAAAEPILEAGATWANLPADLANATETAFLSLPTPDVVQDVARDLAKGARLKQVVDLSTTGPRVSAAVAHDLAQHGIAWLDAPVSGGVAGARKGTLAVMAAGPRGLFDSLQDALSTFGTTFYVGATPGQGQVMKLANNLLSAAALAVSSEAIALGVKAGLDPRLMCEIINAGTGRNSATQDKFPKAILPRSFDIGFATGLCAKDVRLCLEEAQAQGVPMIVGSAVEQILAVTSALHGADSDFTSIAKVIEQWAGVELRG